MSEAKLCELCLWHRKIFPQDEMLGQVLCDFKDRNLDLVNASIGWRQKVVIPYAECELPAIMLLSNSNFNTVFINVDIYNVELIYRNLFS